MLDTDDKYLYFCYPAYMGTISTCKDPDSSNANVILSLYDGEEWINDVLAGVGQPHNSPDKGAVTVTELNNVKTVYYVYRMGSYNTPKLQKLTITKK